MWSLKERSFPQLRGHLVFENLLPAAACFSIHIVWLCVHSFISLQPSGSSVFPVVSHSEVVLKPHPLVTDPLDQTAGCQELSMRHGSHPQTKSAVPFLSGSCFIEWQQFFTYSGSHALTRYMTCKALPPSSACLLSLRPFAQQILWAAHGIAVQSKSPSR